MYGVPNGVVLTVIYSYWIEWTVEGAGLHIVLHVLRVVVEDVDYLSTDDGREG
jgi:hypothetical protein